MERISLCAWHFLFVYFVGQCINALDFFQPSLHQLDFFKKSFYRDLYVHVCISVYKYVAKNCLFEVLMTKNLLLV